MKGSRQGAFCFERCVASSGPPRRVFISHFPVFLFNCGVIALLDYGSGNLRSVEKALKKVGADVRVTKSPAGIGNARGLVLPGVGAFDDCVNAMARQELFGATREWIQSGKPFLGICVGYQ